MALSAGSSRTGPRPLARAIGRKHRRRAGRIDMHGGKRAQRLRRKRRRAQRLAAAGAEGEGGEEDGDFPEVHEVVPLRTLAC